MATPRLRQVQEVESSLSGYRRFEQVLDEPAVGSDGRQMQPGDEWINGQLLPGGEIGIGWAEHIGDVARFVRDVERVAGCPISRITGTPSVRSCPTDPPLLGDMIAAGTFDCGRFGKGLERTLSGRWHVRVDPDTRKLDCLKEASG